MYKFDEICELIKLVSSAGVASVEVEHAGSRVRIDGAQKVEAVAAPAPVVVSSAVASEAPQAPHDTSPVTEAGAEEAGESQHQVTSPIVGTFYRAPNPDADPYVKVGDFVEKGQILCIVEAMKLMNEIESDVAGTIVKVLPENAQAVEFGENLFQVRLD
jgi:acetyl-CoA carboxylase biotin carboxyl carrier protein